MDNSILRDIKFLLGITDDETEYDSIIIMHINSVMLLLRQKGIGPEEGFWVNDENTQWKDFLSDIKLLGLVKSYIHLKVKLLFDPPANSIILESIKSTIAETEWHLTNPV